MLNLKLLLFFKISNFKSSKSLSREYFYRWASLYLYKYQESNNPNVPKGDDKEVFWVGTRYTSVSGMPETADMADPKNIFVSWKFFEREILNDYLGVTGFDKNVGSGIDWNSSTTEICLLYTSPSPRDS